MSRKYLSQLVDNLRNPSTPVRVIQDTFISGAELVQWLMMEQSNSYTLEHAISVGQQLVDARLLIPLDVSCKEFYAENTVWFTFEDWCPKDNPSAMQVKELMTVLKKPMEFLIFSIFLEQSRHVKLLEFWTSVEALRMNLFPGQEEERVKAIMKRHIETSENSNIIFQIPSVLELYASYQKPNDGEFSLTQTLDFFYAAQAEIYTAMNAYFARFAFC